MPGDSVGGHWRTGSAFGEGMLMVMRSIVSVSAASVARILPSRAERIFICKHFADSSQKPSS